MKRFLIFLCLLITSLYGNQACPVDWQHLDRIDIQLIPAQCFGNMTNAQISEIPFQICRYITSEQLVAIPDSVANGFTPLCISLFPDPTFASFSPSQVASLDYNALNSTSESQMSLWSTQCAGLYARLFSQLGRSNQYNACSGITPACMANINPSAFTALTSTCMARIQPTSLKVITASQLHQTDAMALSYLTAVQLACFTSACSGLSLYQMFLIGIHAPYDACAGLNPECIGGIPDYGFVEVQPSCLVSMQVPSVAALSWKQVRQMEPRTISSLEPQQISVLSDSCAGFLPDQISAFNHKFCASLSSSCIANIPLDSITGFSKDCIQGIDCQDFSRLGTKFLNLHESVLSFVSSPQLDGICQSIDFPIDLGMNCSSLQQFDQNQLNILNHYNPNFSATCMRCNISYSFQSVESWQKCFSLPL